MTDAAPHPHRPRRLGIGITIVGATILSGCGAGSTEPTAVIWTINDDATVSLCDDEGLRTYQLSEEGERELATLQAGTSVRFEVEPGTDDDVEPVLTLLRPVAGGEPYTC